MRGVFGHVRASFVITVSECLVYVSCVLLEWFRSYTRASLCGVEFRQLPTCVVTLCYVMLNAPSVEQGGVSSGYLTHVCDPLYVTVSRGTLVLGRGF